MEAETELKLAVRRRGIVINLRQECNYGERGRRRKRAPLLALRRSKEGRLLLRFLASSNPQYGETRSSDGQFREISPAAIFLNCESETSRWEFYSLPVQKTNVAYTNHGPETISRLTRAYLITGQHSTISLILHIVYPFMVVDCSTARPRPGCNCAKRQRWLLVLEGSLTGRQQADRFYLSQTDRQSVVGLKNSNFLRPPPLCKAEPRVGPQPEWRWQLFMNFCPFPLTCCG